MDLILGGNRYIDCGVLGIPRTTMAYWRQRAKLESIDSIRYLAGDASYAWAVAERKRMEEDGVRRVAKHEERKLKMREYARAYYAKHREQCLATNRAWRAKNAEYVRAYDRKWYAANAIKKREEKAILRARWEQRRNQVVA